MVEPAAERDAFAHLQNVYGMSELRACQVLGRCRMTMRYHATRIDDGLLGERMKAIALSGDGSAIDGFTFSSDARDMWSITRDCFRSIARRS